MDVITLMKKLGYEHVNSKGVCYGLALMAAQAIIRGEGDRYSERIEKIHQYKPPEIDKLMDSPSSDKRLKD